MIALVASVAACTDDYKDWAEPQVVPQPTKVSFADGSIQTVGTIDFNSVTAERVQVCAITAPTATDASYEPQYTIALGDQTFDLDADGTMTAAKLQDYVIANYGRRPVERVVDATVSAWLSNGTTTVKTATSGVFQIKAIPEAPQISRNYYLVGGTQDWAESARNKTQKFQHSDKDVYEDPIFTIIINAAEGDTWFAIGDDAACEAIANDNDWSKLLGTTDGNGQNGLTGTLDFRYNLSDDGSLMVPAGNKFIKVTLNMMDYTYVITPLSFSKYFYEIGNESGWSTSHLLYSADNDGKYQGYYWLDGEFKFKPNADNWDDDVEYVSGSMSGTLVTTGGPNCPDPGAGFYQINLDMSAMTYNLVKVEAVGIIGGFNGWGGDVDMAYNQAEGCWEATTTLDADTELKFRANHDWAINWGGDTDNLTQDGANLQVSAGTYKFQLYISYAGNNKVVITKQ